MPHAKSGEELKVGDRVIVEYTVKEVWAAPDYCNIQLQHVEPFWPDEKRFDCTTINAKMIKEKVK